MNGIPYLINRIDQLLDRVDSLLPIKHGDPDWNAHAFRWRKPGYLQAIDHPHHLQFDNLLHIERQKDIVERNTRQCIAARSANNVLLWGARGTGKSTLVRALLTRYSQDGLRLIEVDKQDLIDLPDIVAPLYGRDERFIIFTDDLSFEADDPSYKALKAILDGSIAAVPDNVLLYATSNRRHLMPEFMAENQAARIVDGEIHHDEAVEEKLSLAERFGVWVSFYPFKQEQYLDIVFHWLRSLGCFVSDDERETVRIEALRSALHRGARSGRVANQFARDYAGRRNKT